MQLHVQLFIMIIFFNQNVDTCVSDIMIPYFDIYDEMLHATQLKRAFHYSVKITKSITLFTIYTDTSGFRRDAFRTHRYTRDIDYFLDS